jgi:hypothetical protein
MRMAKSHRSKAEECLSVAEKLRGDARKHMLVRAAQWLRLADFAAHQPEVAERLVEMGSGSGSCRGGEQRGAR